MIPPAHVLPPAQHVQHAAAPVSTGDLVVLPVKPGQIIGRADTAADGTIVVILDTRFNDGTVLHTQYGYAPGTQGYKDVVKQLGPFTPGHMKIVYAVGIWAP